MKIQNPESLAVSDLRKSVLQIAEAGLAAIDTGRIVRENVHLDGNELCVLQTCIPLASIRHIIVAGIGKCAGRAAAELERALGDRIADGLVITIGETPKLERIRAVPGTHPFPSTANMEASKELLRLVSGLHEDDLVIFLTTGGGSTLLCLPEDEDVEREAAILRVLMNAGAPIEEINTVRKHMSRVRGGFLAQAMYPAHVLTLIMNDVPGSDDIGFIASGPTVRDATTVSDAQAVLDKYGIAQSGLLETPKDEKYFERVRNVVVVSNRTALEAMRSAAQELGFGTEIRTDRMSGEARDTGKAILKDIHAAQPKTALVSGGETTVTIKKGGRGGRNLELSLSALSEIGPDELILAFPSDGRDNGEFAGAICDIITKREADAQKLDIRAHLDANETYPFFEKAGSYLVCGDTGSNVSDLVIALKA